MGKNVANGLASQQYETILALKKTGPGPVAQAVTVVLAPIGLASPAKQSYRLTNAPRAPNITVSEQKGYGQRNINVLQ